MTLYKHGSGEPLSLSELSNYALDLTPDELAARASSMGNHIDDLLTNGWQVAPSVRIQVVHILELVPHLVDYCKHLEATIDSMRRINGQG